METTFKSNNLALARKVLGECQESNNVLVKYWNYQAKPYIITIRHRELDDNEYTQLKIGKNNKATLTQAKIDLIDQ